MLISEALVLYAHELLNKDLVEKTHKNYRTAINSFIQHVGDVPVEFLGLDHINQYKQAMREEGNKNSTINTNLSKIRQILKFLSGYEMRVLDYRKITRDKEVREPQVILKPEEVDRLVNAASNPRDKALIRMYFGTGCRLSEILDLDREPFERAEMVRAGIYEIWVFGKGRKYRPVYFTEIVREAVGAYLDTRKDYFRPLFMSNQNRRLGGSRVEKMLHEVTRKAGLTKRVTPHVARHTFVTDMAAKNAPIPAIADIIGHKSTATTLKIYTHIQQHHSIDAFAEAHKSKQVRL